MDAYRDQYATLFGNKKKVTLLAISVDPDTMLAAWAKEKSYHGTFLSDSGAKVGRQYGAIREFPGGMVLDNRTLFIVDKKGRIAHVMAPFREMDPTSYTELGAELTKVAGNK